MTVDEAVSEILGGKKYAGLDRSVVGRIYSEMAPKYAKYADVVKAVKKELHIIYGSFLTKDCHAKAEMLISNYSNAGGRALYAPAGTQDMYSDKDFAARLMGLHASTSERAADADSIYRMAGSYIRPQDTLLDIGCGYNPFSLPFLPTKPKSYFAYDICMRTINLVNSYFEPLAQAAYRDCAQSLGATTGTPAAYNAQSLGATTDAPAAYSAQFLDATTDAPAVAPAAAPSTKETVVIFMFKLFPLLEHQKKGRAFELLSSMSFRTALISFPTKSASGREKGMEAFYTDMFTRGLPKQFRIAEKAVFDNEIFYVLYT